MLSALTTFSLVGLTTFHLTSALPAPIPAFAPSFEDILSLSPRDLEPAYLLEKRIVEDYSPPKPIKNSIAYFPEITSPAEGSSWLAGAPLTVAWNNTLPNYAPNQIHTYATLLLGYTSEDSPGLHLDIDNPLANVTLYGAEDPISVILPRDLPTRSTYLLVLGSTANMSPLFTINSRDTLESSSSVASSPSTSTGGIVVVDPSSSTSSEGLSTKTVESSSSPVAIPTTTPVQAQTRAAQLPTTTSQAILGATDSEDPSPSSENEATSPIVVAAPSSASPSTTSSIAPAAATPASASGGALAAASAAPTSGSVKSTMTMGISTTFVLSALTTISLVF